MAIEQFGSNSDTTPDKALTAGLHYVDWAAILAGTVVASAIAIVLFSFGTGLGLSMVSPCEGEGASRTAYFLALGIWSVWIVVSSFMAGGYIAGRLRRRIGNGTAHEVEVRDSAHGLAVWATGVVAASLLLAVGVSGVLGSAVHVASSANDRNGNATLDYTIDALFRGPGESTARSGNDAERREVARLLTYGMVRGELTPANRMYLNSVVAGRTGLAQTAAEERVEQVLSAAKQKADVARKTGIIVGFLTAAALLIAAAAAARTATLGGKHRDEGTDTSYFWRWR